MSSPQNIDFYDINYADYEEYPSDEDNDDDDDNPEVAEGTWRYAYVH